MARTIHPFPARMASEIALAVIGEADKPLRVLDPMCGSGTVLSLAVRTGHQVTGYDMDPLAVLVAGVSTRPIDLDELAQTGAACLTAARRSRAVRGDWPDRATEDFARYWFAEPQFGQLVRLSRAISDLDDSPTKDALQVGLSRLIVTKSPRASLAADTAHSRPHRVVTISDYDVFKGFDRSINELGALLESRELRGTAAVHRGDARSKHLFGRATTDLIVTSPPYLNAIDYLRGHRLALIWMGHSLLDLRTIRTAAIGSEARRRGDTTELHEELVKEVVQDFDEHTNRTQNLILRYAHDMLELSTNVEHCLVAGGRAVMVVADSVLRGRRVPTGKLVERALARKGLAITNVESREIPATLRYLPVSNAGPQLAKRMKHEYVIHASKRVS